MKNIVLIGMRAAGKTKIGKKLAQKLNKKFVDLDNEIEKSTQKKIFEIVNEKGWKEFRKIEQNICAKFSKQKNLVISTGGGIVEDNDNINNLKKNGFLVFLQIPLEILKKRLTKKNQRPSLTGKNLADEIDEIWEKRKNKFLTSADLIFSCNHFSENSEKDTEKISENLAKKIISIFKN